MILLVAAGILGAVIAGWTGLRANRVDRASADRFNSALDRAVSPW